MWNKCMREETWAQLSLPWDLIVIGGGITGAGVLREAANAGLRCLLLEANDFSFGTSSRSSKLVHGGIRYMRNRQFDMTRESVRERQWMLRAAKNLVNPLPFILPNYSTYHTPNWELHLGVILLDFFGHTWKHSSLNSKEIAGILPELNQQGMLCAFRYEDANVDDSRLVLRLLQEAVQAGASALNYARVTSLMRDKHGQVCGVVVQDYSPQKEKTTTVQAKVVIQATGPWTDNLRSELNAPKRIRLTRGSHLVFSREHMPLNHAVALMHPVDRRAMFAIPWESVCLVGTTDLDHGFDLQQEPYISQEEISYILEAIQATFPSFEITQTHVLSTYAGVRSIVSSGTGDPSAESRAHAVWEENGLFTITGGKLTTFRVMMQTVLQAARTRFAGRPLFPTGKPIFNPLPQPKVDGAIHPTTLSYLLGRHGNLAADVLSCAHDDELTAIDSLSNLWVELRWAAREEAVMHLDDLLLRRVRLGLQVPEGGMHLLDKIRSIVQPELDWDDARWEQEAARYRETWQLYYSPSPGSLVDIQSPAKKILTELV
jgi:glycerol-3-phosphate dehydrogenase